MYLHATRVTDSDEIFKDPIDDLLIEASGIPKGGEVKLQGLALNAQNVGNISDVDRGEIRLTGNRAHRGKFRAIKIDPVTALLEPVRECFERFRGRTCRECGFGASEEFELPL